MSVIFSASQTHKSSQWLASFVGSNFQAKFLMLHSCAMYTLNFRAATSVFFLCKNLLSTSLLCSFLPLFINRLLPPLTVSHAPPPQALLFKGTDLSPKLVVSTTRPSLSSTLCSITISFLLPFLPLRSQRVNSGYNPKKINHNYRRTYVRFSALSARNSIIIRWTRFAAQ